MSDHTHICRRNSGAGTLSILNLVLFPQLFHSGAVSPECQLQDIHARAFFIILDLPVPSHAQFNRLSGCDNWSCPSCCVEGTLTDALWESLALICRTAILKAALFRAAKCRSVEDFFHPGSSRDASLPCNALLRYIAQIGSAGGHQPLTRFCALLYYMYRTVPFFIICSTVF